MVRDCDIPHKHKLIRLSAEQRPRFTHTARGGKKMAMTPRKMSLPHMVLLVWWEWEWQWLRV